MQIEIANQQTKLPIDADRLKRIAIQILGDAGYDQGSLSLAVVDDPTIHDLNRRHLAHDYPTDVLSFCLEEAPGRLEGEVIVSAETAITGAKEYGWAAENELLLYVIHGVLHLVGYRDKAEDEVLAMREAEQRYLQFAGVELPPNAAQITQPGETS